MWLPKVTEDYNERSTNDRYCARVKANPIQARYYYKPYLDFSLLGSMKSWNIVLVLHHAITSEWERGEGANERCVLCVGKAGTSAI